MVGTLVSATTPLATEYHSSHAQITQTGNSCRVVCLDFAKLHFFLSHCLLRGQTRHKPNYYPVTRDHKNPSSRDATSVLQQKRASLGVLRLISLVA